MVKERGYVKKGDRIQGNGFACGRKTQFRRRDRHSGTLCTIIPLRGKHKNSTGQNSKTERTEALHINVEELI